MTRGARVVLVALGLAGAGYGGTGWMGGRLGPPPWWEVREPVPEPPTKDPIVEVVEIVGPTTDFDHLPPGQGAWCGSAGGAGAPYPDPDPVLPPLGGTPRLPPPEPEPTLPHEDPADAYVTRPVPGRNWISGAVVAIGLLAAAWAAWPRRQDP